MTPPDSPSPRTEAGRALLYDQCKVGPECLAHGYLWPMVAAIEAEAAQEAPAPDGLISLDRLADHLADVCGHGGDDWEGAAKGLEFLLFADGYAIRRAALAAAAPSPAEPPRPEIAWAIHRDSSRDRHPPECEHGLAWEHCFRARPPAPATKAEIAAGLAQIAAGETPAYIRGYNAGFDEGWQARAEAHPPEGLDPELVSLLEDAIGRFRQAGRENTALWFENALAARLSARGAEPGGER